MKKYWIGEFDIGVNVDDGFGELVGSLKENPPNPNDITESAEFERYNLAMDGIESMLLAHACAGVDIEAVEYVDGLRSALQGCAANC
jgi:hypothetical protein